MIKLEKRIKELEQQLVCREAEITRLREMHDQSIAARFAVTTQVDNNGNRVNVSKGKLPENFMASFEYLAGRMRDI
jgi:hypothetical protein